MDVKIGDGYGGRKRTKRWRETKKNNTVLLVMIVVVKSFLALVLFPFVHSEFSVFLVSAFNFPSRHCRRKKKEKGQGAFLAKHFHISILVKFTLHTMNRT